MLKVGIVQMSVKEGEIEENLFHMEKMIKKYKHESIDLLCFPELCISGYKYDIAKESFEEEKRIQMLAAKNHLAILAGICLQEDGHMYDAVGLWDEQGVRLGIYRKIHLWETENGIFEQGDRLSVIPFKEWKIGILICADLAFSQLSVILKQRGCDVIFYPSAWGRGPGFAELFVNCGRIRAAENQIYTVVLNRGDGDEEYCGCTTVSNPDGTILASIEDTKEQFVKVVLEKRKIAEVRKKIAWTDMRQDALYKKLESEEKEYD